MARGSGLRAHVYTMSMSETHDCRTACPIDWIGIEMPSTIGQPVLACQQLLCSRPRLCVQPSKLSDLPRHLGQIGQSTPTPFPLSSSARFDIKCVCVCVPRQTQPGRRLFRASHLGKIIADCNVDCPLPSDRLDRTRAEAPHQGNNGTVETTMFVTSSSQASELSPTPTPCACNEYRVDRRQSRLKDTSCWQCLCPGTPPSRHLQQRP